MYTKKIICLVFAGILSLLLASCSQSSSAFVTFRFNLPASSVSLATTNGTTKSIDTTVVNSSVLSSVTAPSSVQKIYIAVCENEYSPENLLAATVVSVTSNDPNYFDNTQYQTVVTLEVPAGDNRKFLVYGAGVDDYGNYAIQYVGTHNRDSYPDGFNLSAGEERSISVQMSFLTDYLVYSYSSTNYTAYLSGTWYSIENSYRAYGAPVGSETEQRIFQGSAQDDILTIPSGYSLYSLVGYSPIFGLETTILTDQGF